MPTCVTDLSSAKPATGLITPGLYDGLSCNFGNFAKGAGASVRVFLQAGSTLAHDPTWRCFDALTGTTLNPCPGLVISGKVAEAVGGNVGGNNNTFYAYGDERSPYFVSGAGLVAGLFSKQHIQPSSHAAGTALTTIDITPLTGDYVVTVDEVSAAPTCPTSITTCSTTGSTAHVNFGAPVSPYFVWTVQFPVSSTLQADEQDGVHPLPRQLRPHQFEDVRHPAQHHEDVVPGEECLAPVRGLLPGDEHQRNLPAGHLRDHAERLREVLLGRVAH